MIQKQPHPLTKLTMRMLPFSDAVSDALPFGQLMRLSLFQVSVGMASVMLLGTLNRVMIVELSVGAMVVAFMIALPVLIAPFRTLLGFRSDTYRSAIGWKRIPYLWFGSLWQFGGLAIMPFALLVLSGTQVIGPGWAGEVLAAIAFLMTGLGLHMTQTAGLALAADRATEDTRPGCCNVICNVSCRYGAQRNDYWLVAYRFHKSFAYTCRSRRCCVGFDIKRYRTLETGKDTSYVKNRT